MQQIGRICLLVIATSVPIFACKETPKANDAKKSESKKGDAGSGSSISKSNNSELKKSTNVEAIYLGHVTKDRKYREADTIALRGVYKGKTVLMNKQSTVGGKTGTKIQHCIEFDASGQQCSIHVFEDVYEGTNPFGDPSKAYGPFKGTCFVFVSDENPIPNFGPDFVTLNCDNGEGWDCDPEGAKFEKSIEGSKPYEYLNSIVDNISGTLDVKTGEVKTSVKSEYKMQQFWKVSSKKCSRIAKDAGAILTLDRNY